MPRVTSLDGRIYELDEETLAQSRIPDEEVEKLGLMPPLPPPPAGAAQQPSSNSVAQDFVQVRRGPDGSTVIDIRTGQGGR